MVFIELFPHAELEELSKHEVMTKSQKCGDPRRRGMERLTVCLCVWAVA